MSFVVVTMVVHFYYRINSSKKPRKRSSKKSRKDDTNSGSTPYCSTAIAPTYAMPTQWKTPTTPYYTSMVSPGYASLPYHRLHHHNTPPTIGSIQRSTSDNCLCVYEKIHPPQQNKETDNGNVKLYEQIK